MKPHDKVQDVAQRVARLNEALASNPGTSGTNEPPKSPRKLKPVENLTYKEIGTRRSFARCPRRIASVTPSRTSKPPTDVPMIINGTQLTGSESIGAKARTGRDEDRGLPGRAALLTRCSGEFLGRQLLCDASATGILEARRAASQNRWEDA